jgi:hypothetical protein
VKTFPSARPWRTPKRAIGCLVGGDHAERDVLVTTTLDRPRRALADRVRVEHQRDHHLRVERRTTPPVLPVPGDERREVELLDNVQHELRQVIGHQPLAQARRQQQLLHAVAHQEVLRHPGIVLIAPDISTGQAAGLRDSRVSRTLNEDLCR